jgi:hypothetical protein
VFSLTLNALTLAGLPLALLALSDRNMVNRAHISLDRIHRFLDSHRLRDGRERLLDADVAVRVSAVVVEILPCNTFSSKPSTTQSNFEASVTDSDVPMPCLTICHLNVFLSNRYCVFAKRQRANAKSFELP